MSIDKICVICGKHFLASRIDTKYCGRACQNKAARERARAGIDATVRICSKCEKEFHVIDSGYNRRYCYDCVPKTHKTGAEARNRIKTWALEYKGAKCELCGYDKCSEALEFHHLNPNDKDFSISDRDLVLDWGIIKKELDKCILVCSNCHREIHSKQRGENV